MAGLCAKAVTLNGAFWTLEVAKRDDSEVEGAGEMRVEGKMWIRAPVRTLKMPSEPLSEPTTTLLR